LGQLSLAIPVHGYAKSVFFNGATSAGEEYGALLEVELLAYKLALLYIH